VTGCGLLLCDDLIFASRVTATARAHNGSVTVVKRAAELLPAYHREPCAAVILDLHADGLDVASIVAEVQDWTKVIAFGSHVDAERLKAARQAGCALVLPRSAFVKRLEDDLAEWLS
jgi:DNA-binding NarL/FixJ family response regulator